MMEKHIVSQFDNDLEAIQAHILKMGGLVEMVISDSMKAFVHKDIKLAQRVRSGDAAIDALEGLINEEAARVIALRAPTAVDLRIILSVIKVSANLKRIGDYVKNVTKRTGVLIQMNALQDASNALRRLGRGVELMLKDALDAYVQKDVALAEDIISRDNDVDQMYERLFRQFITYRMEDPRNITAYMHLLYGEKY